MKFVVKHEIKGRIRIQMCQKRMTYHDADTLFYYLNELPFVISASVHQQTMCATIRYHGDRNDVIEAVKKFKYKEVEEIVPESFYHTSSRQINDIYKEKMIINVVLHFGNKIFLPAPIRTCLVVAKSVKYIWEGLKVLAKRKIEVPVLDGTAIAVSVIRGDFDTASSTMFLLSIGELLEEWTRKKSVDDLARSMSLNVTKVWMLQDGQEVLVPHSDIRKGDQVVVHMGNLIPFDGIVVQGEAMVNQSSLTGESVSVRKAEESSVYAGTVIEEGDLTIEVKEAKGSSKFEKIVTMIEDSEKLKSSVEGKAAHLADKLVPYTLAGSLLTYVITRNTTKALSVLMVDFSCALKLTMPLSVLSAIREANEYDITVKGGKYLEAMAEADTIVFDKTGTLTMAQPSVVDIMSFNGEEPNELLRIAACLEEHFPHSMANAIVQEAVKRGLVHEELHSQVEYIVAHGISAHMGEQKVIIGSYHFVFEDEHCTIPKGTEEKFASRKGEYSNLYLAIDGVLAGVICIEDPLRKEAPDVIKALKKTGIKKVVMMTGDSLRTARSIAARVGVDTFFSDVLPEDKAHFIEEEKKKGHKVIMIGDGVNDSPALSAADVGIAISDGAEIAREIADITVGADDLYELIILKEISNRLMKRINLNYRIIVGFNAALIGLGVTGILAPTVSALLHNTSTLAISLKDMNNLIKKEELEEIRSL